MERFVSEVQGGTKLPFSLAHLVFQYCTNIEEVSHRLIPMYQPGMRAALLRWLYGIVNNWFSTDQTSYVFLYVIELHDWFVMRRCGFKIPSYQMFGLLCLTAVCEITDTGHPIEDMANTMACIVPGVFSPCEFVTAWERYFEPVMVDVPINELFGLMQYLFGSLRGSALLVFVQWLLERPCQSVLISVLALYWKEVTENKRKIFTPNCYTSTFRDQGKVIRSSCPLVSLDALPVTVVHGIGSKHEEALRLMGITTLADVRQRAKEGTPFRKSGRLVRALYMIENLVV